MLTQSFKEDKRLSPSETLEVLKVDGPGKWLYGYFFSNNPNMRFRFYVDKQLLERAYICTANLNPWGYTAATPGIQLLLHNAEPGDNLFLFQIPFEWETMLRVTATNVSAANRDLNIRGFYMIPKPKIDVQEPVYEPPDPEM